MYNTLTKKSKSNKGFTLIELIVVIAIIAILALLLVPRFGGFTQSARESADDATGRTIRTAIATMMADGRLAGTGTLSVVNGTTLGVAMPATFTYTPRAAADTLVLDLQELLGTGLRQQAGSRTGFNVVVDANGEITVTGQ